MVGEVVGRGGCKAGGLAVSRRAVVLVGSHFPLLHMHACHRAQLWGCWARQKRSGVGRGAWHGGEGVTFALPGGGGRAGGGERLSCGKLVARFLGTCAPAFNIHRTTHKPELLEDEWGRCIWVGVWLGHPGARRVGGWRRCVAMWVLSQQHDSGSLQSPMYLLVKRLQGVRDEGRWWLARVEGVAGGGMAAAVVVSAVAVVGKALNLPFPPLCSSPRP